MRLVTIRHGETEWNVEGREMGWLDSPLTPRGVRQAEAIADRLAGGRFAALYASDLGRAMRTAEAIAARCGLEIIPDAGLRERNMGLFQGLAKEERIARYPDEHAAKLANSFEYVIPGGESARQRRERGVGALTAIAERHPDEEVIAVTHGGLLTGIFESVLGLPHGNHARFRRTNASYSAFQFEDGAFRLLTWNDVSHLETEGLWP